MNSTNQSFRKNLKKHGNTERSTKLLNIQNILQNNFNQKLPNCQTIPKINQKNSKNVSNKIKRSIKNNEIEIGKSNQKEFHTIQYLTSLKRRQNKYQIKLQSSRYNHGQDLLRACKSTTMSPKIHENQILNKTEVQKLKIFNHINDQNCFQNSVQMVQFIKQAVSNNLKIKQDEDLIFSTNEMRTHNQNFLKQIKLQQERQKSSNDYKIGQTRKQIKNIESWIKEKLNFLKENQSKGESIITDRILYLNMAFVDSSRIAGCFCTQVKELLEYLINQYHSYYNYLFECLSNQNKKILAQMNQVQNRLQKTISHYEQKHANIKKQQQQRSIKVIKNFKKCIQMKENAQKQVKYYKMLHNQEKKKVKVMEEGLLKVISLFLSLGQKDIEELVLLPNQSQTNINKSVKRILTKSKKQIQISQQHQNQKRKQIFQQWCGYIIKMVMKIMGKNSLKETNKQVNKTIGYVENLAFQIIQKYLVDNDSNLSMKDAQTLLNNFISVDSDLQKIKKEKFSNKQENIQIISNLQQMNKHFNNLYKQVEFQLPTIEQVIKKNKMKNIETQASLRKQTYNQQTQYIKETGQIGFQIQPRIRQKGTCMKKQLEDKLNVQLVIDIHQDIKNPKIPQKILTLKVKDNEKVELKHHKASSVRYSQQVFRNNCILEQQLMKQREVKNQYNQHFQKQQTLQIGINTDQVIVLPVKEKKKKTVDFSIIQEDVEEVANTIKTITINNNSQTQNNKTSQSQSSQLCDNLIKYKRSRKNGIYINGRNKTQISMKFIAMQTEHSQSQSQQKSASQIKIQNQKKTIAKTQKQINFNQERKDIRKSDQERQKKYETLEQRINKNRSYFNLQDIEFQSKSKADLNRIKHLALKAPKKKLAREKLIDSHDFHIQLAFKNQQKMKFISSVTLWHPRYFSQLKKTKNRIFLHPQIIQANSKHLNAIKNYISHNIDPICREYVKIFSKQQKIDPFMMTDSLSKSSEFGFNGFTNTFPISRQKERQIVKTVSNQDIFGYYHRLSPLSYLVLNTANSIVKSKNQISFYFNCLKSFKSINLKTDVYSSLIEGGCVELDIFIRALHYFSFQLNFNNSQQTVSYYSLSSNIFDILQGYCSGNECQKILKYVLKVNKQVINESQKYYFSPKSENKLDFTDSKQKTQIKFFIIIKSIFKHIKEKQQIQLKKYQIIQEIISKNCISTYYEDVKYFLECLPLPKGKKNKILAKCLKYTVYWQKNQPTIPNDILYFIFDDLQLYNTNNTDGISVIRQYLINRCQLYFKGTLNKVTKNPDWVLQETYLLFYKTPKLFHRLSNQAKMTKSGGNKKIIICLLVLIFCNLIDSQMDKRFVPALLNGLFAIPYL